MMCPAVLSDARPALIACAILTLGLVACGGERQPPSSDTVQRPAGSTPVVPAVTTTRSIPVTVPAVESRPTTWDDAGSAHAAGLVRRKEGDFRGAEVAFERALALDPRHVKSLLNLARVLLDQQRDHEALERIDQALALDSTSSDGVRLLARVHHRLGEAEKAVASYRRALVLDERDVWAMNNLGMLYIEQQDPASALPPLARAVALRPTAPVFQNNLGMALELTGHLVEAKQAYDAAVRADSTYRKAVKNAERLADIVTDPAEPSAVVRDQAELFRQHVRMWKEPEGRTP